MIATDAAWYEDLLISDNELDDSHLHQAMPPRTTIRERHLVKQMYEQGTRVADISRHTGRSKRAIYDIINRDLGDNYQAVASNQPRWLPITPSART